MTGVVASALRPTASHGFAGEERWGYSQAIVAGGLVHTAGQVPRGDGEKPLVAPFDVGFASAFELLESAINQVGCTVDDLVYVQLFVFGRDVEQGAELYRQRLGTSGSALSLIVIDGLNHPDYSLEVSATAVAPMTEGTTARMEKRIVSTGNPLDERLGRAAAVRVGDLIYVSGQPSVGPDGNAIADDSFVAHYERAFSNFLAAVEAAGGTGADVVSTHTLVTDPVPADDAEQVAGIHRAVVGSGPSKPASTLVRVSALSAPNAKVEVSGVAVAAQG
jgi:enamine deaminase RidA (YjgF/YER057c/UK114 family)